jgi:hypothetical protein
MRRAILACAAISICFAAVEAQTGAPRKPAAKPVKPVKPVKPAQAPLAPADDAQLAAAERTLLGVYACEFRQTLQVAQHPTQAGYVVLRFDKQLHTLKPVLSSTGALRLEDVKGRLLMIQIAFKSMLLDAKAGRRLVDECLHEQQALARQAAASEPAQPGIGIDPAKAALAAEAAALAAAAAASAAAAAASAAVTAASAAAEAASATVAAASAPASAASR